MRALRGDVAYELTLPAQKIILKVLEAIPSQGLMVAESAEEANLHKLKDVFTSCMDVVCRPEDLFAFH